MRILQIHNSYLQRGGEDRLVQIEADALRSAGDTVIGVHVSNPDGVLDQARAFAVAPWNPGAMRTIEHAVIDDRPDLAHVHNTWYRLSPSILSTLSRRGIPVVMTVHNYRLVCANGVLFRDGGVCTDCVGSHPWHAVVHQCYRDSAVQSVIAAGTIALHRSLGTWEKYVDRFIVASEFAGDILATSGIDASRIRVVPPVIPDPGERPSQPSDSNTVVYLGRIDEGKGLALLLDAWAAAAPDLELQIIGTGPQLEILDDHRVPGVRFMGWMDRAPVTETLLSSRALVFPSMYYETLGLSFVEGLAAGLPLIANDLGPRREVVGDSGAAWLTRPGSVEDWKAALSDASDDGHVNIAGAAARSRYQEIYSVEAALKGLRSVYQEVMVG